MTLANTHRVILNVTTVTMACVNHQRQRPRRDRSIHGLLMLALYLPLVLMIAIGPMIANTDHFHQTISHGPVAQAHHHLDAIAQADALELGAHHVHLSDSLQLNALVAGHSPAHPHANRDLKITNPLINYADVFPDGLLRPPQV